MIDFQTSKKWWRPGGKIGAHVPMRTRGGKAIKRNAYIAAKDAEKQAVKKVERPIKEYVNTGEFLKQSMDRVMARVKLRTLQGKDYQGQAFKGYTPKYDAWKRKQGAHRGRVDLWVYGDMAKAVAHRKFSSLKGQLYVRSHIQRKAKGISRDRKKGMGKSKLLSTQRLAEIHHKGEGKQPAREWFAWKKGSREDGLLIRAMQDLMDRKVRQLRGY